MNSLSVVILFGVSAQRIAELVYGRANEARLRARGAVA